MTELSPAAQAVLGLYSLGNRMTEPSRRERYLKALEIAERYGNRFMAANIRAELRKLESQETRND